MPAPAGGVKVIATMDTMRQIAQQLVCWDATPTRQQIQYRTDGNLPYFYIPPGLCDGAGPLTLTPGGTAITCPTDGATTYIQPAEDDVSGVNPNTCEPIAAPTGLAGSGTPTADSITVTWTAPAGTPPTGYRLAYYVDEGPATYVELPGSVTTATVNGLTANTAYSFKVQAKQGTYSSAWSPEVTVTTAAA